VALGTWIAHGFKRVGQGKPADEESRAGVLPGHVNWTLFGVLIGLAAGAVLSGLLVAAAASLVPVLPLAALIITLALAWTPWSDPAR
jgi:hypothetical protein